MNQFVIIYVQEGKLKHTRFSNEDSAKDWLADNGMTEAILIHAQDAVAVIVEEYTCT